MARAGDDERTGPTIVASACRARWHLVGVAVILATSAWFRLAHLDAGSLIHDEAWRANICYGFYGGTAYTPRRLPPLQSGAGWLIQHTLGRTELAMRLPSALCGIGCVLLAYLFTRRHLDRGAALAAAAVVGFHPLLVTYSRQAKGFSLEALAAVALLWVGVEVCRRRSSRAIFGFAIVAVVAMGFTFTASLVIAAWMPILAVAVLWHGPADGRLRRSLAAVVMILMLAGGAWYVWLSGCPVGDMAREHPAFVHMWPKSYGLLTLGTWMVSRTDGILRFVLGTSVVWSPLKWFIGMAGFLALVASAGTLWKRCRPACLFAALLTLEVFVVGALRLWPIGELRTMAFLIPLFAIAVGCGLQQFVRRMGLSPATIVIFACCVFVPAVRATKATLLPPPLEQHTRPVFAYTAEHLQPDDTIFIHYEMRDSYGFYWRDTGHPTLLQPYDCRDNVSRFAEVFDAWIAEHRRVWFVFMLRRPSETELWIEHLEKHYRILDQHRYNDAATFLIERRLGPKKTFASFRTGLGHPTHNRARRRTSGRSMHSLNQGPSVYRVRFCGTSSSRT